MTDEKNPKVEVLPGPRRAASRRVFSVEEKRLIVEETLQPGSSVSLIARKYNLSPSLVFRWRKLMEDGSPNGSDHEPSRLRDVGSIIQRGSFRRPPWRSIGACGIASP